MWLPAITIGSNYLLTLQKSVKYFIWLSSSHFIFTKNCKQLTLVTNNNKFLFAIFQTSANNYKYLIDDYLVTTHLGA